MKYFCLSIILFNLALGLSQARELNAEEFHTQRKSLENSFLKFEKEKKGRVVFLGGSITHNAGWRDSVSSYIQQKFPKTEFDFINAGIPSMGSTPGAFRFRRDVLKNGPVDLLFVEAAVNDATNQRSSIEIIRGMEGIVRHAIHENPEIDVLIMHFVDPDKMKEYRDGKIPKVIQLHEKVAEHYNIPTLNLAKEVTERIDNGEFDWENDFKDLHPSPFGQNVYFRSVKRFLEREWNSSGGGDKMLNSELPEPIDSYSYSNGIFIEPNPPAPIDGWQMVENWQPDDKAGTRQNYVNVPFLVGTFPGEVIKFPFEGNAVGIAVAAGPDAGIIEYSIDNSAWEKLDLFTAWSGNLHLPWYYTLASGLKNRKHMLQLRMTDEKNPESNGKVCRLRYFYFNAAE